VHEHPFWNPFGFSITNCSLSILQYSVKDFRVYLTAGVKNANFFVIFRFSFVTFLKYWNYSSISPFIFFGYILFKNCSNLSLNSSGVYLYNSELMLSSPGLLPFFFFFFFFFFFVNFNACSNSADVIKVSM